MPQKERCACPTPVIEITPEMIEAGRRQISRRWLDFTSEDHKSEVWCEVLAAVFLAMTEARQKSDP